MLRLSLRILFYSRPLLALLRLDMALPAEGGNPHIVMALVTKLALVGMAIHAGILQALVVYLSCATYIEPVGVPDRLISPLVQHFHVLVPYI